jgi:Uma2 family endonuclease
MNLHAPAAKRPATYQDVLDAPPNMVAEIVNGALSLQPRPAMRHGRAAFALSGELSAPFQRGRGGPGGWWFAVEPELHLGPDVLVPDLAGWRRERMPQFPGDAVGVTLAPDWLCEVLSPSTRTFDTTEKRDIYARAGVEWLWLVDPLSRVLEVFRLDRAGWRLVAALHDDAEVAQPPFEAAPFPLDALWPDAPPQRETEPEAEP